MTIHGLLSQAHIQVQNGDSKEGPEWGLKVTFKSVGTANMSNRSNSIGAIDMPILSLEGNYNGGAGGH